MKKTIISSAICLVIGCIIGAGSFYFYQKKSNEVLENAVVIENLEGTKGDIEHNEFKNYPDKIVFNTTAKKPGKIKTIIKKSAFCPKIYKNSLSLIVGAGITDLKPIISYGIEYKRQVFSRFNILTGIDIETNVYRVNGFKVKIGAGVNL